MATHLPDGVAAAVKIVSYNLSLTYLEPSAESADAVTKWTASVMAMLGAWSAWLDCLPREIRSDDIPKLFGFVISMLFKLTQDVGRTLLQQRIDLMKHCPENVFFQSFDTFMQELNVELEAAVDKLVAYVSQLHTPDALIFDQLLNACLHFVEEVHSFGFELQRPFAQMRAFADKVLTKVYRAPCLHSRNAHSVDPQ